MRIRDKLKKHKVETLSLAVIFVNALILKKDFRQIKRMKEGKNITLID